MDGWMEGRKDGRIEGSVDERKGEKKGGREGRKKGRSTRKPSQPMGRGDYFPSTSRFVVCTVYVVHGLCVRTRFSMMCVCVHGS